MKTFKWLISLIITTLSIMTCSANSLKTDNMFFKDKYKEAWAKVDSLESKGLPKSALEEVDKIYEMARKDHQQGQFIKAVSYRLKFKSQIEDNTFDKRLMELEQEIQKADYPNTALMQSMLAEMYWWYYQNNQWKIQNRTETINFQNDSIETWSLTQLADKVIELYETSLNETQKLQQTPIDSYREILYLGTKPSNLRTTLYDFLAHRAIDFFANTTISVNRPAEQFALKEEYYFADAQTFANENITTKDTMALQFYAIKTLQELLKFHLQSGNNDALIDADLKRLDFVHSYSTNLDKSTLYLNALKNLESKFGNKTDFVAEVMFKIAQWYNQNSTLYNPLSKETDKFKSYHRTSYDLCTKIITAYPKSAATGFAQNLQNVMLQKMLSFESEKWIIPNQKSFIKITYQNIDTVYLQIASIDRDKAQKIYEKYYESEKYIENAQQLYYDEILKASKAVQTKTIALPVDKDLNTHSVEFPIDELALGKYFLVVADNKEFTYKNNRTVYNFQTVTNFSYLNRTKEKGEIELTVLDRNSGIPIVGATVNAYYNEYSYTARRYKNFKLGAFTTDSNGKIEITAKKKSDSKSLTFDFIKGTDYMKSDDGMYLYRNEHEKYSQEKVFLFTDRAIYRPGQTIYFKGITLQTDGDTSKIVTKQAMNVVLYDVNHQKVSDLNLTTNDYGTFSGTFQIPTGLLNGQMQIYTYYGSKYVSVEEYKRPQFEVEMLPFDGNYRLNDTVTVKGSAKAFSGAKISDAKAKYRVMRTPIWKGWWSYYFDTKPTEVTNGTVETDEKGEFTIKFKAVPDLSMSESELLRFTYQIEVDVTDLNGETQSGKNSITVGKIALDINLNLEGTINKSDKEWTGKTKVATQNLNGQFIPAEGTITISQLKDNPTALRNRYWTRPDKFLYSKDEWKKMFPYDIYENENEITELEKGKTVAKLSFNTGQKKEIDLSEMKKWKSGRYVIEMESKDAFGAVVTNKKFVTLFSQEDKKVAYPIWQWVENLNPTCEVGEKAEFLVGTSESNVQLIYEIEHQNKIIKRELIVLNNEQKVLQIPVIEAYRGNFSAHFTFVKNNRLYSSDEVINVPYTNKELDIEFETFRNKLFPGENEEWKIKIKDKKGDKLAAEMLATLYDASLDKFRANSFDFNILNWYYASLDWKSESFEQSSGTLLTTVGNPYFYGDERSYDHLNWFNFSYYTYRYYPSSVSEAGGGMRKRAMKNGVKKSAKVSEESIKGDALPMDVIAVLSDEDASFAKSEIKKDKKESPSPKMEVISNSNKGQITIKKENLEDVKVRTNFSETAFFYPHLETDSNGSIIIKFTIPESLTRWKMMGFAHTKDLKYGFTKNELVTQKDLMVVPNAPRFFRENDKITFPVKISNLSDKDINGTIQLEMFDATSMQTITSLKFDNQKFKVKAGLNTVVDWTFEVPEKIGAMSYRIKAKAGNFTDGEEKTLPVLTNRMLVTESMPLPIRSKQTKTFEFKKLMESGKSNTLRHHKLTLEFTSQPAWYAIQALPYLIEYPYECAEQVFSRFYANSLASHVANSSPKVKAVFDSWKNTPDSKALLSNLEKNQELKTALLEETPWVLDAKDETERKHRVGLLFDLNRMSNELASALKKLEKMQVSNGGFPWFPGMPESRYITQHVVAGMGHLDHLGVKNVREDKKAWKMVQEAIEYLDTRIKEDYDYLKRYYKGKELAENHLSYEAIHYFYARSFFKDVAIPSRSKEAFEYYKGQSEKYWLSQGMYAQGMIALYLQRFGNQTVPTDITKSLKENSQSSEEMGMFWKTNVGGYYWYQAPIETQALMIEVFDEVAKDNKSVDDLKVWLLKQKQTQDWKTTKATVEAVYALLLKGTNWLASDEMVKINIGGKDLNPKDLPDVKVEAGTGYFKTSWTGSDIKPEMGKITLTKTDEGVAWGALYWQYFEQLDKITPHETPLKLIKKLFVERITDKGNVIEPVTEKTKLKVGDKIIVRIELRVDRAMEYIHLKDMRASGFEPINVISQYKYQDGLGYYECTKDAATNFFIGWLPKGTFVFEYPLRVTHNGDFSNGITTIQCMYAPEFSSHSEGIRVKIEK